MITILLLKDTNPKIKSHTLDNSDKHAIENALPIFLFIDLKRVERNWASSHMQIVKLQESLKICLLISHAIGLDKTLDKLNPIEHLWDQLKQGVRRHNVQDAQGLRAALVAEWHQILQTSTRNLIRSMRQRCIAVRNARGRHCHI